MFQQWMVAMDGGDGYTLCTLIKDGKDGKFYSMCISPKFKKRKQ